MAAHAQRCFRRARREDMRTSLNGLRAEIPTLAELPNAPTSSILEAGVDLIRELEEEGRQLEIELQLLREDNHSLKAL